MNREGWNVERYQVDWCAKWCNDNRDKDWKLGKIPEVKVDRFEARNDGLISSCVRCQFPAESKVYFYEVICVTNERTLVGWTTRKTKININGGIGDDEHSIGLEVGNDCYIRHDGQRHYTPTTPSGSLNVVGCLIDLENQLIDFYLNGQPIDCDVPVQFCQPYFATVCFANHQHCHFNFGQSAFKFPPTNIQFTTFDEQSGGDVARYRLGETQRWAADYWFGHTPVDNQVSLFFDDEMQNEFNREVRKVEGDIQNDEAIGEWSLRDEDENDHIYYGHRNSWKRLRYIQAIIEEMGKVREYIYGDEKVDVMAQWVGRVIENTIDKVYGEKLLELIYPYLQLVFTQSSLVQHRSICIVLLHLIKCCRHYPYNIIEPIRSSVFTYLIRTFTSTDDHWTQLFVLIALGDLEMSEAEKREIDGCEQIQQMVETCRELFEGKNVGQFVMSGHWFRIHYQLFICSHKLTNSATPNTLTTTLTTFPTATPTLNPNDLSTQITLSPCRLSARCACTS